MRIQVNLRPDRANAEVLEVWAEAGHPLFSCPCLGKADNQGAIDHDNPSRDPTKPWGDTPLGRYGPTEVVLYADKTKIGEASIPLSLKSAVGEQAEAARASGRYGLHIHAGRGSGSLMPSYGRLRVLFKDFIPILYLVSGYEFFVTIEEGD